MFLLTIKKINNTTVQKKGLNPLEIYATVGCRKSQGKINMATNQFTIRMTPEEKDKLDFLALSLGFSYTRGKNKQPSISKMMKAIANNDLTISWEKP